MLQKVSKLLSISQLLGNIFNTLQFIIDYGFICIN